VEFRWQEEIQALTRKYAYSSEVGFEEAVMQLVNQSSTVLRCGCNPGVPQDHQKILDKVQGGFAAPRHLRAQAWSLRGDLGFDEPPKHLLDVERAVRVFEIQSGDQYQESQGLAISPVRSLDDIVKQLREEVGF